ncbi:Acg family FMN-binding oxidoreductase [Micromonospora globispora]|uniref:Acg family FMN-binding oxidoreductase n=1 Tax=Micromonospora globispora TaxID=1450148 RepID=UPI001FB04ACF|nr:nitroreductase [Micromonospora globispora]
MTQALVGAATVAGYAPSIHNTQPWRWRVGGTRLGLFADRARALAVTDPDARLATLSCGAALQHARIALAAQGWRAIVTRIPDPTEPDHLAQLRVVGRAPVELQAVRRTHTIRLRHTDRRPLTGPPVGSDDLRAIADAVQAEGAWLHILRPDQVTDLAAAASHAQQTETADPAWQAELAYWTGGTRPAGARVPDDTIPLRAPQTTVPGRDFGHHGDLPVSTGHDRTAGYAVLYGPNDQPVDWLRAGEALSSAWLTAVELGVSVLPLSATVEVAGTRQTVRRLVADLGHPYLVVRLGMLDTDNAGPPHAPRLPAQQRIDRPTPKASRPGPAEDDRPSGPKGGGRHDPASPPTPR